MRARCVAGQPAVPSVRLLPDLLLKERLMRFECEREAFASSLKKCVGVSGGKDHPILNNVLITTDDRSLSLKSTDLQLTMRTSVDARVIEPGSVTVPAKLAYDIARILPEPGVTCSVDGSTATIESGSSTFRLPTMPPEDFPSLDGFGTDLTFIPCDRTSLMVALSKISYVIPPAGDPFSVPGAFIHRSGEKLRLVGADGHRLAWSEMSLTALDGLDLGRGVVVPQRGVVEIGKLLELKDEVLLAMDGNRLVVRSGGTILGVELLQEEFPEYQLIVPEERPLHVDFDVDDLKQCLARCQVVTGTPQQAVRLELRPGEAAFIVRNADRGEARNVLPVDWDGEEATVALSVKYLSQTVAACSAEKLRMEWVDPMHACCFVNPVVPGTLHLIMPMVV